jgi:hypothetical protein
MAYKYERPYRVQPGRMPVFETRHQALDFLAEYQRRRAMVRAENRDQVVSCPSHRPVRGSTDPGLRRIYQNLDD